MDGLNSVFKKITNANKICFKQIFMEELKLECLLNTLSLSERTGVPLQ